MILAENITICPSISFKKLLHYMSPLYIKQSVNLIDKDNKIDFNSWNIYFWCQGIHNTFGSFHIFFSHEFQKSEGNWNYKIAFWVIHVQAIVYKVFQSYQFVRIFQILFYFSKSFRWSDQNFTIACISSRTYEFSYWDVVVEAG